MDTIELSDIHQLRPEVGELLKDHWKEVARNKSLMVLDPDWEKYQALDDSGVLLTLAARRQGRLVGYSVTIIGQHLHYRGLTVATNDVIYLSPGARSMTGFRLVSETEQHAAIRGAELFSWHAKPGTALDRLLKKRQYGVQDIIYSRQLRS